MVWRQFGAFYTALKYLALFLALLTKFLALLRHFDLAALKINHGLAALMRRLSVPDTANLN